MQLVKKIIIKPNHKFYDECDKLCFLSKNIYNVALYNIRQNFFQNETYLSYVDNYYIMRYEYDYSQLPDKVSKQTLRLVDKNYKSFFALFKKKNNGKYNKPIDIPKYLNKSKGRFVTIYEKNALNKKDYKKTNCISLSKTNISINLGDLKFDNVNQVRIVPKNGYYKIEIIYTIDTKESLPCNGRYASVDLGINNLATIGSNVVKPFIINGKPLKSINQYYNKKKAKLQSKLKNKYSSKRIEKLTNKKEFKIDDYLHKASKFLVNHLVSNNINTLIVGYNKGWKQDIKIGKKNNQKFVNIPFLKFINLLEYKCRIVGISVILTEESYTSKCSFIDNEELKKQDVYMGNRIKRGLFKAYDNKIINADLNGSLNILRKVVPNFNYENGIEGITVSPVVVTM